MTKTITCRLVGERHHPPAKAILACLGTGYPLELRPVHDNPFDANAIEVWVSLRDLPEPARPALDELAKGYGTELAELLAQLCWMLGFVAADEAAVLASLLRDHTASARLTFNPEGRPLIAITLTEQA